MMPRSLSIPILVAVAVALALAVLALQGLVLPLVATSVIAQYPELTGFVAPLAVAAVAAGLCMQLALLAGARIAVLSGTGLDRRVRGWIDLIIGAASLAAVLGVGAFVTLDGPVGAMPPSLAAMLVLAISGAAAAVVLAVRARRRVGRALSELQA